MTFTLETGAKKQTGTYEFTVLPPATAPAHPQQQVAKSIPGLGTWEKQMVELGNKWCEYRDQQNIAGNFVDNWGWTGDAWFYDGGRSFENIDTYTAAAGHPNHAYWQHCAINLLDPYANWQVANDANMQGFSTFTYGMAMNYQRDARRGDAQGHFHAGDCRTAARQRRHCRSLGHARDGLPQQCLDDRRDAGRAALSAHYSATSISSWGPST